VGPWRFDVLRVLTSVVLGGRARGLEGPAVLGLTEAFLEGYLHSLRGASGRPSIPKPVQLLLRHAETRTRARLLAQRCRTTARGLELMRGELYRSLPERLEAAVRHAFVVYAKHLPAHAQSHPERFEILDIAFRVAGTGSLGTLRAAILTRGKGGRNGAWLFDVKEERASAAPWGGGGRPPEGGERVVTAASACLKHAPRLLGTAEYGKTSFVIRPLAPQEDKLNLIRVGTDDLGMLMGYLGSLVGAAHGRAARTRPRVWSRPERHRLQTQAIELAALHEGAYLAYCLRTEALRIP
jgi:uncharacterized protein (DUF2252 family)